MWSSARACSTCPASSRRCARSSSSGMISIEYEANPKDPTADVTACVQVVKDSVKKLG